MKLGIAALVAGYVLSQFYRAFLAVLAPSLQTDLGLTEAQLADASGFWFLGFALMQIPIGIALDRVGPRLTSALLMLIGGGGGAAIFATANSAFMLSVGMFLIGTGCAPVLMATFYILARTYAPAVFGTIAGAIMGFSTLGNLGAALPLSLAVDAFGWRGTMGVMALVTLLSGLAIWVLVQDPPVVETPQGGGGMLQVLKNPALWGVLALQAVSYSPAAAIRGLWVGPYFSEVFSADAAGVGTVTLLMGIAMIIGNLAYGPMDRVFGTRKGVILVGTLLGVICLGALWWQPAPSYTVAVALIAAVGLLGMAFPLLMAHGRAFFPPHLLGRGVTLMNLFSTGGVGVWQVFSGRIFTMAPPDAPAAVGFGMVFGFFAILLAVGGLLYAIFAQDRTD